MSLLAGIFISSTATLYHYPRHPGEMSLLAGIIVAQQLYNQGMSVPIRKSNMQSRFNVCSIIQNGGNVHFPAAIKDGQLKSLMNLTCTKDQ